MTAVMQIGTDRHNRDILGIGVTCRGRNTGIVTGMHIERFDTVHVRTVHGDNAVAERMRLTDQTVIGMIDIVKFVEGKVKTLDRLTQEALSKAVKDRDYEYEHLAVYFVYRYFMKCRFDEDVRSKAALVLFCLYLIHLLDVETFRRNGSLSKEDRVQNAKLCSKEIEYSEENLDLLAETL